MKTEQFEPIFEWAILPTRRKIDTKKDLEKRKVYSKGFRWYRAERQASFCKPFQLASTFGWLIHSPVDITFSPIEESQFEADDSEIQDIAQKAGFNHVWNRNGTNIGIKTEMPLRLYDFKKDNNWEAMFILNGGGTLEWKLGFKINLKSNQHVLTLDNLSDPLNLCVPGILSKEQLDRMNKKTGFSLAISPKKKLTVLRGDVVGIVTIITDETLKLNT